MTDEPAKHCRFKFYLIIMYILIMNEQIQKPETKADFREEILLAQERPIDTSAQ